MRNQFAGVCYRCGKFCAAGEGHFQKVTFAERHLYNGAKWLTQHAHCAIKYRGTTQRYWINEEKQKEA